MSTATFVPAKPPVTKVVEVSPGAPAKVFLELTPRQAATLRAILGNGSPGSMSTVFDELHKLAEAHHIPRLRFAQAKGSFNFVEGLVEDPNSPIFR